MFPYLPQQSGYNKRLRSALPLVKCMIRELAMDSCRLLDGHRVDHRLHPGAVRHVAPDTLNGQLYLEQHGGRTFEGVAIRVAQCVLALASAVWHNNKIGAPVTRSLVACDH